MSRLKSIFLCFISVMILSGTSSGRKLYVPTDYGTIQNAIDNTVDGDTVIVTTGTYYENIDFSGKNILVGSYYVLTDNYAFVYNTIIDGGFAGPVVRFSSFEDSTAVLAGLTLQHGSGYRQSSYNSTSHYGGGVYCRRADPVIRNNYIIGNIAYSDSGNYQGNGGGIYCADSKAKILNNVITANSCFRESAPEGGNGYGGGISAYISQLQIIGNTIHDNRASEYGGGIQADDCDLLIEENTFTSNEARFGAGICLMRGTAKVNANDIHGNGYDIEYFSVGAGIFCYGTESEMNRYEITNNVIRDNEAPVAGGISTTYTAAIIENNLIAGNEGDGLYCLNCLDTIINNTVLDNFGAALVCYQAAAPEVKANIFWDNNYYGDEINLLQGGAPDVSCCLIRDGWSGGADIIDADPQFCDPGSGSYEVNALSPCLPANNACGVLIGLEGEGCFKMCGDVNGDTLVNIQDVTDLLAFYFTSGEEPFNYDMCDLDENGKICLVDIILLIYYIDGTLEPWCTVYSGM